MKFSVLLLCSVFPFSLWAFRLDPMSATIELKDGQEHFNFVIENETAEPLPVQISLFERKIKETGEDELKETEEILAFPDQIIVPPEQKRSVKVTWSGKAEELKTEKAFRFVAEQLPLELKKDKKNKTGIKMLLKYVAALYVNPEKTESNVSCVMNEMNLHCENKGNKHQILKFKSFSLEGSNSKVELRPDELKRIQGENILASSKRTFILPPNEKIKTLKGPMKVNFKLE